MGKILDQLDALLQLDLHDYIKMAFTALEAPTTTRYGGLGGSAHADVTNITDSLKALIYTG